MTVYVDNFRGSATVGRTRARWSHLTADTPDELHEFAARLGQRRAWFQATCRHAACPKIGDACVHFHYDVVDHVRTAAIKAGAQPIDVRDMGAIIALRRRQFTTEPGLGEPEPCQPIGCDNGYHLRGCCFAALDDEATQ